MSVKDIQITHDPLMSIGERIEITPTSVHRIGQSYLEMFCLESDVTAEKIIQYWDGDSGGTMLWEYIFDVLKIKIQVPSAKKDEAIIITDGLYNRYYGIFHGLKGYNHMITSPNQLGINLCISVICIGNKQHFLSPRYRDLAATTGGVFLHVDVDISAN